MRKILYLFFLGALCFAQRVANHQNIFKLNTKAFEKKDRACKKINAWINQGKVGFEVILPCMGEYTLTPSEGKVIRTSVTEETGALKIILPWMFPGESLLVVEKHLGGKVFILKQKKTFKKFLPVNRIIKIKGKPR